MTSSVMKPIVEDTYSLGDNNYNSTSTNRKHRSFSLSLSALSRSRSKDDIVKKPGDSIDSVDLITSSKLFSQSQPSLPINNNKNAKKSKVIKKRISNSALSTSSASSSSSSSSSSSIFHRWSSFGRKSKQSKESEQWWQEFEREVDPSLLKTADSSLAVSSKSKDGCKPLAKSNYSSPSVRPSVLSDSPQHIFRRQHDKIIQSKTMHLSNQTQNYCYSTYYCSKKTNGLGYRSKSRI
ncbi:hypothetical protein BDF19DRAFT_56298 [Syncephalis fuscata]|nr:hypothetical protein BDF19DRAFT_56298 [Syncephalis fuscata]